MDFPCQVFKRGICQLGKFIIDFFGRSARPLYLYNILKLFKGAIGHLIGHALTFP
jgi:hypothetical protein